MLWGHIMTTLLGTNPSSRQNEFRSTFVVEGFNLDGVEIARIRRKRRWVPWRQVYLFVLAVLAFKIALYFNLGPGAYGGMIDEMLQGNTLERMGGILLTLDPISEALVQWIHNPRF